MSNSELSPKVASEIEAIFKNNPFETPHEVRFRRCSTYIKKTIESLLRIPNFWSRATGSFFSTKPSRVEFSIGLDNFTVEYYKKQGANIEENLELTVNSEKIRLHTYKYKDGRVNSQILYFDDAPEFVAEKYLDPESNEIEALRVLEVLEKKSSS